MNIAAQLVEEFGVKPYQIKNALALFDDGATVPFVARYRKEQTGSLDEIQLRDILHKYDYYRELDERRAVILESIEAQGKLTAHLRRAIEATLSKTELEDWYLPYKPKRVTRGKKALEAGLEPLARWLTSCADPHADLLAEASRYIAADKGFETAEKALGGACDILAEELSDDAENRKWLRDLAWREGQMVSCARKAFADTKTKFSMYYDFREPVKELPSHRVLAMLRGEREKTLRLELDFPRDKALARLESRLIVHERGAARDLLAKTAADSLDRLLSTATETDIRRELRERAEEEAFRVFGENLRELLLAPPAGSRAVLGVDPGFRTGCKIVALDATGKFLEYQTIYPHEPRKNVDQAAATIRRLIDTHAVELIAIGNGTASRETERFIRGAISDYPEQTRPISIIVNESGASVYSASEVAIREFPEHDLTVRGAVSIARRLQDPLSELVKIEPKSIGVGQYQHDVNQAKLKARLEEVVESCVNRVGVDCNLASEELLKYVSGLNRSIAGRIVAWRNEHGAFRAREDLRRVSGLGDKTFEQAAGFLRISGAPNPLDNSSVHPERYAVVSDIAQALRTTIEELIGNGGKLRSVNREQFVSDAVGLPTIDDIFAELEKPGRDPRAEFTYASFDDAVSDIGDLRPGMKLEGTVTNVTNFGAFVDIGVHQDGLVHISEMADRFVDDPRKFAKVGQVVTVTVKEADAELKRIALTMKKKPGDGPARGAAPHNHPSKHGPRRESGKRSREELKTARPKFSVKQFMK